MIVVSATFVAEPLDEPLAYVLAELGIEQEIRFAPYHQVFQMLLTPGSDFDRNRSGTNILLLRLEDFVRDAVSPGQAVQKVLSVADELGAAIERFVASSERPLLLCLLPASPTVVSPLATAIETASSTLHARLARQEHIQWLADAEVEAVAGAAGDRYDARRDQLAHIPFSDTHFAAIALALARRIHALSAAPAKVLVLDCDNTLWRGVVGEEGVDGIGLSEPYLALQDFALAQQRKGVLLCLASKNAEADVLAVLRQRGDMRLREQDLVGHRINWLPKVANLRSLAKELNLGLDAFVFMDDNPLECAQMRAELPQVLTLQVPPEAHIQGWLGRLWALDKLNATEEDARRTAMYQENAARRQMESSMADIGEFIAALDLKVDIRTPQDDEWPRIEQLTQRTNQFNFSGRRRSVPELKDLQAQGAHFMRVQVSDRFGDYGLVGLMIGQVRERSLVIDSFLLSCRVLGRGVEHAMLRRLGEHADHLGLAALELELIASPRNEPARAFIDSVATADRETGAWGCCYRLPVSAARAVHHRPGHDPQALVQARLADQNKGSASASAGSATAARSERYTRLAELLVSGDALLQQMASRQRRARGLATVAEAAASPLEERLRSVWEAVLGIEHVGVEDDYFALGGTSLQSVKLFSEIERCFGVQLRLTSLLQAPTVRTLADLVSPGSALRRGTIVTLRSGGTENLFLVHDGLGETLLYLNLARDLPAHLSVLGIEPRRLPGMPMAHASMEDMAACYVDQIQSIQPHGPYCLGGMCAGGVIAYAMAARLRALGEAVHVLTLLDAAAPQAPVRRGRVASQRLARLRALGQPGVASHQSWTALLALPLTLAHKAWKLLRFETSVRLSRLGARTRFALMQVLLSRGRPWPQWLPELSVAQVYAELSARYQPPALPGVAVLLVRANEGEAADTPFKQIYRDAELGWRALAADLTLTDVSGGHSSMLQERHVGSLTQALLAYLPGCAPRMNGGYV